MKDGGREGGMEVKRHFEILRCFVLFGINLNEVGGKSLKDFI